MNPLDMSPEQFRRLSKRVIEIAADYLEGLDARTITPDGGGAEMERVFRTSLPEAGLPEEAIRGLVDVARHSRAQNGRFLVMCLVPENQRQRLPICYVAF
jgi:hypothetical protein